VSSAATSEWPRLAGAAIAARDELRMLAADLTMALASGRIQPALVVRARDLARRHADGLRFALKHPAAEPPVRRMNRDLPYWSTLESGDR
jgi:hypothetical protein